MIILPLTTILRTWSRYVSDDDVFRSSCAVLIFLRYDVSVAHIDGSLLFGKFIRGQCGYIEELNGNTSV